jgi:hypothetical protein
LLGCGQDFFAFPPQAANSSSHDVFSAPIRRLQIFEMAGFFGKKEAVAGIILRGCLRTCPQGLTVADLNTHLGNSGTLART